MSSPRFTALDADAVREATQAALRLKLEKPTDAPTGHMMATLRYPQPATQAEHTNDVVAEATLLYAPGGHAVHAAMVSALYVPVKHAVHTADVLPAATLPYPPFVHTVQADVPVVTPL